MSSPKYSLRRSIYVHLDSNRNGSFNTRASRKRILNQAMNEIVDGGYRLRHVEGLKRKHIKYLNSKWLEAGLSAGTIRNRNAHLRWLCRAMNKPGVAMTNKELGVPSRIHIDNVDRSIDLADIKFDRISNERIEVALHLQYYFGLRREESLKIEPHWADKGSYIRLKGQWCKGKRARIVPIHTREARYWLDRARALADGVNDSLIERGSKYVNYKWIYDYQVQVADTKHPHGLRHKYAQLRYKEITGMDAPCKGGVTNKEMTGEQLKSSMEARRIISAELGHARIEITGRYLGKF